MSRSFFCSVLPLSCVFAFALTGCLGAPDGEDLEARDQENPAAVAQVHFDPASKSTERVGAEASGDDGAPATDRAVDESTAEEEHTLTDNQAPTPEDRMRHHAETEQEGPAIPDYMGPGRMFTFAEWLKSR